MCKKMFWDFAILYLSNSFVWDHLPSVSHVRSSACSSFLCIRESPSVSPLTGYYSKIWKCMLQKPLVPTACISGDCNQTWPGSGTRGCAGFGIFKSLWQTRGLGNKVQLWIILSCVIRRFLCPKIMSLKLMHTYADDQGNFWLVFAFYYTSWLQFEHVLP